jgi:DNA-binding Lrp family transcriptional regulator
MMVARATGPVHDRPSHEVVGGAHVQGGRSEGTRCLFLEVYDHLVDDLDLGILRWMHPGGVWTIWGIDPRITTAEIAQHLGLRRKAVWTRIRKWKRAGLWRDPLVRLNPRVCGMELFHAELPVVDPSAGSIVMNQLAGIDGVGGANLAFGKTESGHSEPVVQLSFIAGASADLTRIVRLLKRASPTGVVYGPYRFKPPPCARELSPLDWRILGSMVATPGASLSQISRSVGVTLKTVTRCRSLLLESRAIWYVPNIDWSRLPSVVLALFCHEAGDVDRVRSALDARFPQYLPMSFEGLGDVEDLYPSQTIVAARLPAHSPGESQNLELELSLLPGVRRVESVIWGADREFSSWEGRLIAARLAARSSQRSSGAVLPLAVATTPGKTSGEGVRTRPRRR